MRKDLEEKLAEAYPKWFNVKGDIRHTLMPFGFAHGDGWFDLLERLCKKLEPIVPDDFEVLQVKEKFGGLRFYASYDGVPEIRACINEAEDESLKTCEECGKPGKLCHKSGWLRTLCQEHMTEQGYQ